MKHSLICLLILAVLAACSAETKDEKVAARQEEESTESVILVEVPPQSDSLPVDVQQKANEIDVLLEGI